MRGRSAGSPTNASDAIDDLQLPPEPSLDDRLDEAVQETFPASDPVAVDAKGETIWDRVLRQEGIGS